MRHCILKFAEAEPVPPGQEPIARAEVLPTQPLAMEYAAQTRLCAGKEVGEATKAKLSAVRERTGTSSPGSFH